MWFFSFSLWFFFCWKAYGVGESSAWHEALLLRWQHHWNSSKSNVQQQNATKATAAMLQRREKIVEIVAKDLTSLPAMKHHAWDFAIERLTFGLHEQKYEKFGQTALAYSLAFSFRPLDFYWSPKQNRKITMNPSEEQSEEKRSRTWRFVKNVSISAITARCWCSLFHFSAFDTVPINPNKNNAKRCTQKHKYSALCVTPAPTFRL